MAIDLLAQIVPRISDVVDNFLIVFHQFFIHLPNLYQRLFSVKVVVGVQIVSDKHIIYVIGGVG